MGLNLANFGEIRRTKSPSKFSTYFLFAKLNPLKTECYENRKVLFFHNK